MKTYFLKTYFLNIMLVFVIPAVLATGGCVSRLSSASPKTSLPKPIVVDTKFVRVGSVSQTVSVTGSLMALQDISLSAKQAGRLAAVTVREGDPVAAGQVLAQVDAADLSSQVLSDEAAVFSDQAKLQQAQAAYDQQIRDTQAGIDSARAAYDQQVATSRAQVRSSQSSLTAAGEALSTEQQGARPEERLQTEATLASAQATEKKAQSDLNRYEKLHNAGAVSDADLDSYRNTRDVDHATLNSAQAALRLQQKGNRPEDVAQDQEKVRQAEETLRQSVAARSTDAVKKADLETALAVQGQNEVKKADVLAARATLAQAQNTLVIARQAVRDAVVRSPIAGRVSSRTADPGEVITSATVLLHVIALSNVYYEPSVPDTTLRSVRIGQPVSVQVDAFPGRAFPGRVTRIYPQGSSTSRTVPLRITLPNAEGLLRPNMFASGRVQTASHRGVVLVPRAAVIHTDRDHVWTVENGMARDHIVSIGLPADDGNWVEAGGLSRQAQVIVLGQSDLKNGQEITVSSTK